MGDDDVVKHRTKCTINKEDFDGVLKEDKERENFRKKTLKANTL